MAAALAALLAYLATVLPGVRGELKRWRKLAEANPDPDRRRRILAALEEKQSNVEAVAVFATLAPLRQRAAVLQAIVALQMAIDYRDTLEEVGESENAKGDDFLSALEASWAREAKALPGYRAVAPLLRAAVDRCAEGQRQTHAAAAGDGAELQRWADDLKGAEGYRWWELAAGASSSVAAHALIAAAATPDVDTETAALIDAAYNPPIGALTVFLDDLVDREADREAGEHNYFAYYEGSAEAAKRLSSIAGDAIELVAELPQSRRHRAIIAGVIGFCVSERASRTPFAAPIASALKSELGASSRLLARAVAVRRLLPQVPDANSKGDPG
jgi:tetraprenyl-beta-curcumene synthase